MVQKSLAKAPGLSVFCEDYDLLLCDVWGVIHNGINVFSSAVDALSRFRARKGKYVVLLTNAPRPAWWIKDQLESLGMPENAYDDIITSGDVTRREILDRKVTQIFALGPSKDENFYDGLPVKLVKPYDAELVCVTGLLDDLTETPEDYRDMMSDFLACDLPMICANPDIVVERGDQLLYCGGALAQKYDQMGGEVFYFGKPHTPIYESALLLGKVLFGANLLSSRILAIGDGIATDVKGAHDFGLDCLFITAGIHSAQNGPLAQPSIEKVSAFLANHNQTAKAYMPRLVW